MNNFEKAKRVEMQLIPRACTGKDAEDLKAFKDEINRLMDTYYPGLPKPRVYLFADRYSGTAGLTHYSYKDLGYTLMGFNKLYLKNHRGQMLGITVAHEVAHHILALRGAKPPVTAKTRIIAQFLHLLDPDAISLDELTGHGEAWKKEMAHMGYPDAPGGHSMTI